MIISSQRFINDDIVAEKINAGDFEVIVSPEFMIDGESYQVILDGHHSFAAANQSGVAPVYIVATSTYHDAIGILERGEIESFLEVVHFGDDYYNVETNKCVW